MGASDDGGGTGAKLPNGERRADSSERQRPRRERRWPPLLRRMSARNRTLMVIGATLVALVGAYAAATAYTNRSEFCSSCHEMTPYYEAWRTSAHRDVDCINCHVDPGIAAGFAHKFVALREVWIHFTEDPKFPLSDVDLPNERCLRCHEGTIDPGIAEFDHEQHRGGRTCKTCHDMAGHVVTAEALDAAGILNADVQAQRASRRQIAVGNGQPLEGHAEVVCSNCHDMPASTCGACHEKPADHFDRPCMNCHTPDTWSFVHPVDPPSCALCHVRPEGHRDGQCSLCHAVGVSWAFVHPASPECGACHTPPPDHYAGSCASCHSPTVPFAETRFTHPGVGASCSDCHARPSNHPAGQCSVCHRPATTWAFVHPASTACVDCHARPAGHPAGQCSACHRVGGRWAFVHPTSADCAACHAAPANHYGPSCASCHSPTQAWASATFTHPAIYGREHTYRSFPCVDCHPSGFTTYSCLKCHSSNTPDD